MWFVQCISGRRKPRWNKQKKRQGAIKYHKEIEQTKKSEKINLQNDSEKFETITFTSRKKWCQIVLPNDRIQGWIMICSENLTTQHLRAL